MVFHAFASHPSYIPGPYGVHMLADLDMERTVRTDRAGNSNVEESWELRADNGDHVRLELQYVRGVATKGKTETRVHSAIQPAFYRIYRIEQATDVVRSAAMGIDRAHKF